MSVHDAAVQAVAEALFHLLYGGGSLSFANGAKPYPPRGLEERRAKEGLR